MGGRGGRAVAVSGQAGSAWVAPALYERAHSHILQDKYQDAIAVLREAIKHPERHAVEASVPTVRDAAVLLLMCLFELRRYDDCREWTGQACSAGYFCADDPEVELYRLWGRSHSSGDCEEVLSMVDCCIESLSSDTLSTHVITLLGEYFLLRGHVQLRLGRIDSAKHNLDTSASHFRVVGFSRRLAEVCNTLGLIQFGRARYDAALEYFSDALALNQSLGRRGRSVANYSNIGIAHYKKADYEIARVSLQTAIAIPEATPELHCRIRIALGNVYRLTRDFKAARRNLTRAYSLASELHLCREECLALEFLGDVFRDEGALAEASRYYLRGMKIAEKIAPEGDLVMELLRRQGECLHLQGRSLEALPQLKKAQLLAHKLGDDFEEGVTWRCFAEASAALGKWGAASSALSQAEALLKKAKAKHELAICHLSSAGIHMSRAEATMDSDSTSAGPLSAAWKQVLAARYLFDTLGIEYWRQETEAVITALARRDLSVDVGRFGGASTALPIVGQDVEIIAESAAMKDVLRQCRIFADNCGSVLITGATGTGKGLLARHIHMASARRDKLLVEVNSAAVPGGLVESILFGHEKGAFTGADSRRRGCFEQADGGTLFLDEIGDMNGETQARILKAVEEKCFRRVGGSQVIKVNTRIIAATNRDLRSTQSGFRSDLYHRISMLVLDIPSLRDRPEDIIPLLEFFLTREAGRAIEVGEYFSEKDIEMLKTYEWPGNVREVMTVARQVHLSWRESGMFQIQLASGRILCGAGCRKLVHKTSKRGELLDVLSATNGNIAESARHLGVSRSTIYRRMRQYDISR